MHEHTTKAIATLGAEAPVIKSIATPEAEAILTKAVATLEHVETLDMMRVAAVEESNGATTLPDADENQMPTIEGGDTLGRKVANVLPSSPALPAYLAPRLSYLAPTG
jgi:hypothetical protein